MSNESITSLPPSPPDQVTEKAPSGCYISGLYLEGAQWDLENLPNPCPFLLQTDALDRGIGAVLRDQSVAYYSKKLLLGRPFKIQTDHRALVWLNQLKDKNSRLTRWSLSLQPFKFEVAHRVGTDNSNADALSRAASNPI